MKALKVRKKHAQGQRDSEWHREQTVQWMGGEAMLGMFEEEQEGQHTLSNDEISDGYEMSQ